VPPAVPASEWLALSQRIAKPWPGLQLANGRFPDYVHPNRKGFWENYAESFLGYALLNTGRRDGNDRVAEAGLRGLAWVAGPGGTRYRSSFEHYAMARGYRLARGDFADHPLFRRHRAAWERYLRQVPVKWLGRKGHNNQYIVDSAVVLELLATGLRSKAGGAVLGGDRKRAKRLAESLINRRVPELARRYVRDADGDKALVLSDPTAHPLAYHSLSLAFYVRALKLLGDRAVPETREVLRQMAWGSACLTAPDGDLAYFGRSQEQSWALAFTAYGAEVAAKLPGVTPAYAARCRGLADRALARLRDVHAAGKYGLRITPAFRGDIKGARRGVDVYVWAGGYVGLTLAGLNWAVGEMGARGEAADIAADTPGELVLSSEIGTFASVRTPDQWFCVKQARPVSAKRIGDLRFDFGLVAMKGLSNGSWNDTVRLRPITSGARDSAGPHLRSGGVVGLPDGTAVRTEPGGAVVVRGGWRKRDRSWLRTAVEFRFEPVPGGVRLTFPAKAGDRLQYSVFFERRPTVTAGLVTNGEQEAAFDPAATVKLEGGYASGADPKLVRARLTFVVDSDRTIEIVVRRT
jgi:hypothetical protein